MQTIAMTITDLKKYAERMNEQYSPLDKMQVTLRRDALAYIVAYLHDRHRSVCRSLADPKIKPTKRANQTSQPRKGKGDARGKYLLNQQSDKDMTDYKKTKAVCWKELCDCNRKYGETTYTAFDYTFDQAYRYGRFVGMEQAKAQPTTNCSMFGNSEQLRVTAAIAAMEAILSNPRQMQIYDEISQQEPYPPLVGLVASNAAKYANALLAKLDKTIEPC